MPFGSDFKKLEKDLQRKLEAASGNVSFTEVFTSDFMSKYTNSDSLTRFVSNYDDEITNETFRESLTPEFDKYIAENSQFSSWTELLSKARKEYLAKKLKN